MSTTKWRKYNLVGGIKARENTTYGIWSKMRQRCNNPNNPKYHRYGGRGIQVCDRWNSFANFLADMGERPTNRTLGRIDNDGPYSPDNCRWETIEQQANNTRTNRFITFAGMNKTVRQWEHHLGLPDDLIKNRLRYGWSERRAVTTPQMKAGQRPQDLRSC